MDDLALKQGLSPETVEVLLELARAESPEVLTAVYDAVCAVIATLSAMCDDLLRVVNHAAEGDFE